MKKIIYFILPIMIFFLGIKVNALGPNSKWGYNAEVVANVDNTQINTQNTWYNATWVRFQVSGVTQYVSGNTYTHNFNFSIKNQGGTPITLPQCGLNVNGSYVATNYLNYSRSNYECGNGLCTGTYQVQANWTSNNDYGDVPVFIQCDIGVQKISYSNYANTTSQQGSNGQNIDFTNVIYAINNNGQNQISNDNYNTQQIIDNQNSNTQDIIEGQHSLASEVIKNTESQKVCSWKDNATITWKKDEALNQNCFLDTVSGVCITDSEYVTTDYIEVKPNTTYNFYAASGINGGLLSSNNRYRIIGYETNKTAITTRNTFTNGGTNNITTNSNTHYIRISFKDNYFTMKGKLIRCDNGNQSIFDKLSDFVDNGFSGIVSTINSVYNTIATTISNLLGTISTKINELVSFFTNTDIDTSRLNTLINRLRESNPPIFSIITSLKNYVQSFNSANTCQPVVIPLSTRGGNHDITLPCGTTLFWNNQSLEPHITVFKLWWNLFVGGILIYSVGLKLLKVIDSAFDPTMDEVGKGLEI